MAGFHYSYFLLPCVSILIGPGQTETVGQGSETSQMLSRITER